MSFYFPNVDYTYIKQRKGTDDDPFLFLIDTNNVRNSKIMLKEIPHYIEDVKVTDSKNNVLTEVEHDAPSNNEYRVDYSVGIIYVNANREGEELTAEYHGTGYVNISSERVIVSGSQEDPLQSLQDALESVSEGIETLEQVGNLDFKDEYSNSQEYKKWNFVTYGGNTYVAIENTNGNTPHNNEYWRLVSSGVGFTGVYDSETVYTIGDMVSDSSKKNLYISKKNDNSSPLSNSEDWQLMITLDDMVIEANNTIDNLITEIYDLRDELISADEQRDANDAIRDDKIESVLDDVDSFKVEFQDAESTRRSNESSRKSSESQREINEETRQDNESTREQQESERVAGENVREQIMSDFSSSINTAVQDVGLALSDFSDTKTELEIIADTAESASIDVGLILDELEGFEHRDEHDIREEYEKFNIVTSNGSSYLAVQDVPATGEEESEDEAIEITDSNYWKPLALKGKDGTEITIEGVSPDEDNNISLDSLGLATDQQVVDMEEYFDAEMDNKIGILSDLKTVRKGSIVESINELKSRIDDIIDAMA